MNRLTAFVVSVIIFPALLMTCLLRVGCPPWSAMWCGAAVMFLNSKLLTAFDGLIARTITTWSALARYVVLWPGMNAGEMRRDGAPCEPETERPARELPIRVACGLALIAAAGLPSELPPMIRGWAGMIGTVTILHFGLFELLTRYHRTLGYSCPRLMEHPFRADSLADFWGRRWNRPYRELIYRFVFQPVAALRRDGARLGAWVPSAAGFFVSGILHDVIISVPAAGGFGLPTCYFLIQAGALQAERTTFVRRLRTRAGAAGILLMRCWTFAVLLAPLPLLFHRPFVANVMVPFFETLLFFAR